MGDMKTLIIGGATGIGFAVAQALSGREGVIVLAGRDAAKLAAAKARLNGTTKVETRTLDIADEAQVAQLAHAVGPVDNIIVTAGSQAPGGALAQLDLGAAKQAFDTKFWGSIAVARHLSGIVRPGGTLTLTSGFLARRAMPGAFVKTAMNAALEATVKVLARELAPLRVNAVSPGLTDTEAYAGMTQQARRQMLERASATLPAGRFGRAEDVARGYLFILDNPFVTGTVLDIEGGALIN